MRCRSDCSVLLCVTIKSSQIHFGEQQSLISSSWIFPSQFPLQAAFWSSRGGETKQCVKIICQTDTYMSCCVGAQHWANILLTVRQRPREDEEVSHSADHHISDCLMETNALTFRQLLRFEKEKTSHLFTTEELKIYCSTVQLLQARVRKKENWKRYIRVSFLMWHIIQKLSH